MDLRFAVTRYATEAQMASDDIPRDDRGRFRRGKPGGPGRPFGGLTRINAPPDFLRDVVANWERHGSAALEQLCLSDPARYFLLMFAIDTGEFRITRRRRTKAPTT